MNLSDFRSKYPQYNDVPDAQLAKGLHDKYYSDIPFGKFSSDIGLSVTHEQPSIGSELVKAGQTGFDNAMKAYADVAETFGLNKLANAITGNDVSASKYWATEAAKNPPETMAGKIGAGVLGLLGEAPLFVPGGAAGKAAAIGIGKLAPKVAGAVDAVLPAAGSFGGESALRGQSPEEIAKQTALGGMVGGAGKIAEVALKGAPAPVKAIGTTTAQAGALTGGEAAINDQPVTAQTFGETLGTLVALALTHKALSTAGKKITAEAPAVKAAAKATEQRKQKIDDLTKSTQEIAKQFISMADNMKQSGETLPPEMEAKYNEMKASLGEPVEPVSPESSAPGKAPPFTPPEAIKSSEPAPGPSDPAKVAPDAIVAPVEANAKPALEKGQHPTKPVAESQAPAPEAGDAGIAPGRAGGVPEPAKPLRMDGTMKPERAKTSAPEFTSLHPKSQEKFNAAWDAKNVSDMQKMLYPENKGLRAEFENRTGEKLPKTIAGMKKSVADNFAQGPGKQAAKEPWQMTNVEFTKFKMRGLGGANTEISKRVDKPTKAFAAQHKREIKAAMDRGETIPPEALKDYPDLQQKIDKMYGGGPSTEEIIKAAKDISDTEQAKELKNAYSRLPEFTDTKRIIGELTGNEQRTDLTLSRFIKAFNKRIPKDRRVAITHYLQAGGDVELLRNQALSVDKRYRKGFEDATNLTPEEKKEAEQLRSEMDKDFELANSAGIIEDYVDNYVTGVWEHKNKAGKNMSAIASSGILNAHPKEARHKMFASYFEGIQAGFTPKNLDIGFLFATHRRSIHMAIAARKALAELMHAKTKDGSPVVIVGGLKTISEGPKSAYLIKPNAGKIDYNAYKTIDHPAMRRWKWIGNDAEDKSILMEGPMYIHKSELRRLKAILGQSAIRSYEIGEHVPVLHGIRPGDALLKLGGFIKGTILLGPFHQFHLGEHAIFHKVNPFNPHEINFDNSPILVEGVNHGLMLHGANAMMEFAEGLSSGGLIHFIDRGISKGLEKAGVKYDPVLQRYQEWLFQDYIPRLKAAMFSHAFERAEKYYAKDLKSGKITRDQLLENIAKQSNAAFGEQNYQYIGRNKTVQDLLRLGLLAPDFLESRFKFAGQALKPYGKEQVMAFVRGAIIIATTAQIVNMMFGDDKEKLPVDASITQKLANRIRLDTPFTVVIDGREYSPRSVVADMMHLFTDTRGFWYYRLNPLYGHSMTELLSGKNEAGIKETPTEAIENILKSYVPIPAQGIMKRETGEKPVVSTIHALLSSIGITNFKHRTEFEKEVSNLNFNHISIGGKTEQQKHRDKVYIDLMDKYDRGELTSISEIRKLAKKENVVLSPNQIHNIRLSGKDTEMSKKRMMENRMKSFSGNEMMDLWGKMDGQEKNTYRAFVRGKIHRSKTMTILDKREALSLIRSSK